MSDPWEQYESWHAQWVDADVGKLDGFEAKRHLAECMDEYAKVKRELFMDGFADYVVRQGFGAVSPLKHNGKPESWQDCGRRLWGKEHFNEALKRAIERSRSGITGGKTSSRISRGSASP